MRVHLDGKKSCCNSSKKRTVKDQSYEKNIKIMKQNLCCLSSKIDRNFEKGYFIGDDKDDDDDADDDDVLMMMMSFDNEEEI